MTIADRLVHGAIFVGAGYSALAPGYRPWLAGTLFTLVCYCIVRVGQRLRDVI